MATATQSFPLIKFEKVNRPIDEARTIFEQRIADAKHIFDKHHRDFAERHCPICGNDSPTSLKKFHGTYGVSKCQHCSGLYVNPVPNLEALVDYYNNSACNFMLQDLYKKRSARKSNAILDDRVKAILSHIRSRIEQADDDVRLLEVGCGSGRFLANLKNVLVQEELFDRVQLVGVDIDKNAVALNDDPELELHGLPVEVFADRNAQTKFDVVLHFELIEHLGDPTVFMEKCRTLLADTGIMIFTTPNERGFELAVSDYNGFRLLAHGIFPPMHLNAYSTQNIAVFLLRCGFKQDSITTPGNLDADMVSLMRDEHTDPGLLAFADMDDANKGVFQHLLKLLDCSSHMMVVARR